jgi:chemotaxis protein histidine kinase CheA
VDTNAAQPASPEVDVDAAPDAVRDAEAAVAALADSFLVWIGEDIARANQALAAANDKPGDNQAEIRAIFEVVHNVKGQGGSFGYDLLTTVGGSLCNYLRVETASASDKQLKVIAAHFTAVDFVLEHNLMGEGGEIGAWLTGKIAQLVTNIPAPA